MILTSYLQWQFILAPQWLVVFIWNLQRALFQFFSVPIMVRTLFSPWRKDSLAYRGGGLMHLATIFAWNQISRIIGFIIRALVISLWIIAEILFIALSGFVSIFFVLSPFIIILGIWWAVALNFSV